MKYLAEGEWRGTRSAPGSAIVRVNSRDAPGSVALLGGIGAHTRRLSSVRSTATPASTLPTVSETSMARGCVNVRLCCDDVAHVAPQLLPCMAGRDSAARPFTGQATATPRHHHRQLQRTRQTGYRSRNSTLSRDNGRHDYVPIREAFR